MNRDRFDTIPTAATPDAAVVPDPAAAQPGRPAPLDGPSSVDSPLSVEQSPSAARSAYLAPASVAVPVAPAVPATRPVEPRRLSELSPFDPGTVALVRASCALLPEDTIVLTQEFYACLFEMAPAARAMFPADMTVQTDRLLQALLAAVNALDDPGALRPQLAVWGALHRQRYGVTDDLYVYVGHALVRAVRNVIGLTETSVGSAWIAVYEWLAAAMIEGADEIEAGRLP